jgi:hypothetical protein
MLIDIGVLWGILKFPVKAIKFYPVNRGKVGIDYLIFCSCCRMIILRSSCW